MDGCIRVLVVDDQPLFAQGLRLLLERDDRVRVAGIAGSVAQAVALAAELHPDVVLMDQCLSDEHGVDAIRAVRELAPGTAVIVLTGADVQAIVPGAAEAGAAGVLEKTIEPSELIRAIDRARGGESLLSPSMVAELLRSRRKAAAPGPLGALTPRERDVLGLLAEGCDTKAIAHRLGLSIHTTRDHVQSVLEKLDSHSRIEAVLRAGELGLVRV